MYQNITATIDTTARYTISMKDVWTNSAEPQGRTEKGGRRRKVKSKEMEYIRSHNSFCATLGVQTGQHCTIQARPPNDASIYIQLIAGYPPNNNFTVSY